MQHHAVRFGSFELSPQNFFRYGRFLLIFFLASIFLFALRYKVAKARYTLDIHVDHVANAASAHSLIFERTLKSDIKWSISDAITTGLPVLVPVGVFTRIFGANPASPQIAMLVLHGFWAVVLFIVLVRFYSDVGWDLVLALMLVAVPHFFPSWSQVMGEIPSLAALMIALALLPRAGARNSAVAAGAMFALAVATKLIAILMLPVAVLYLSRPLLRDRRMSAAEPLVGFLAGAVTVALLVSGLRLFLSGGFHEYGLYLKRFFGSYAKWTAFEGLARPPAVAGVSSKLWKFYDSFGGMGLLFSFLSVGFTAAWRCFHDPAIDRRARDFGCLLLGVAVVPIVYWFFLDPWLWSVRRIYPAVFCLMTGIACLVSLSKSRALKFLLLATLLLGTSKTNLFVERTTLLDVRSEPDRALSDFREVCVALDKAMEKEGVRTVVGYRREPSLLLKVSNVRFEDVTERIFSLRLSEKEILERISAYPGRFAVRGKALPDEHFPEVCYDARTIFQNSTFQIDVCDTSHRTLRSSMNVH